MQPLPKMQKKLYYGAAYYPELWPETAIDSDLQAFKATGLDVVRMGEFAWAKMEPDQDQISMEFFTRVIDKLYKNGINTIFCTPTPTPPIWLTHGHPERLFQDEQGRLMHHGSRQHICTNNPVFRERSRIIVEAQARAVGRHPGVIAWQTDNEFTCHVGTCCCPVCATLWHAWLEKRYGTVAALNEAWGTEIWSERYQRFDQVPQPLTTPFLHNASLQTAYRFFSREMLAEFQQEQIDIIRQHSDAPITHNSNIGFRIDNEQIFKSLDFAAFDDYPNCDNWRQMLDNYGLWRTLKPGRPFWVMETSTSHNGWLSAFQKPHRTGYLAVEALAAYAAGAQGFCHWLWRQQRSGCELTHGAVLSAWGQPTIGYEPVLAVNRMRHEVEALIVASDYRPPDIAITHSDAARSFMFTERHVNLDYLQLIRELYATLSDAGLPCELAFASTDFSGYKVLCTPYMYHVPAGFLARAMAFVNAGGTWIVGPMTGLRTAEHTVHTDHALGQLEVLAGVETLFSFPIANTGATGEALGCSAPLEHWAALFACRGTCRAVGTVKGGVTTPGLAFLTEHDVGRGRIVMLGAKPAGEEGKAMLRTIVAHYASLAGVRMPLKTTVGTAVFPRTDTDGEFWIAINMDGAGGTIELPGPAMDLLSGEKLAAGTLAIEPYRYRIVRLESRNHQVKAKVG